MFVYKEISTEAGLEPEIERTQRNDSFCQRQKEPRKAVLWDPARSEKGKRVARKFCWSFQIQ
jgi:hypothetical protein